MNEHSLDFNVLMNKIIKNERSFVMRLVIVFLLMLVSASLMNAQSVPLGTFAGGDGTEQSPYLIKTKQQLAAVGNYTGDKYQNIHFKVVENLSFTERDFEQGGEFYNEGKGWLPIGSRDSVFKGVFDGNFKTIKGLIARDGKNSARKEFISRGLFGVAGSCIIKNIILKECSFLASKVNVCYVGGIVGEVRCSWLDAKKNLVTYNYFQGKLTIKEFLNEGSVGGIVGEVDGGVISHNIVDVEIFSDSGEYSPSNNNSGGIVGVVLNSSVINNRAMGKISAEKAVQLNTNADPNVGGIAGHNSSNGVVEKNYARMVLGSSRTAGGIVGGLHGKVMNNVSLCPSIDIVAFEKGPLNAGRIVGKGEMAYVLQNNYALNKVKIDARFPWKG